MSSFTTPVSGALTKDKVDGVADSYLSYFNEKSKSQEGGAESDDRRNAEAATMTDQFYQLVTDFYTYGWGESFHFAPRLPNENFGESIRRHEHYLALRLGLKPGDKVLDFGCGVGGPLSEIATFSGASITGINISSYQAKKVMENVKKFGLEETCTVCEADFCKTPLESGAYDAAYGIEATCHAGDRVACYSEAYRLLKPGGLFAAYEWCVTDKYDENNQEHVKIVKGIEEGNSLPPTLTTNQVQQALISSGFKILETEDFADSKIYTTPWYEPLAAKWTLNGLRYTRGGRAMTHAMVNAMEMVSLAPKGTVKISSMLSMTAEALVKSGEQKIFTPCYYFIAQKPLE